MHWSESTGWTYGEETWIPRPDWRTAGTSELVTVTYMFMWKKEEREMQDDLLTSCLQEQLFSIGKVEVYLGRVKKWYLGRVHINHPMKQDVVISIVIRWIIVQTLWYNILSANHSLSYFYSILVTRHGGGALTEGLSDSKSQKRMQHSLSDSFLPLLKLLAPILLYYVADPAYPEPATDTQSEFTARIRRYLLARIWRL